MQYDQEADYRAFKEQLPELLRTHSGQFAIVHRGWLDAIFEERTDALQYARDAFGIGNYIVQEIKRIKPDRIRTRRSPIGQWYDLHRELLPIPSAQTPLAQNGVGGLRDSKHWRSNVLASKEAR